MRIIFFYKYENNEFVRKIKETSYFNRILDRWGITNIKKNRNWHVNVLKEFAEKTNNRMRGFVKRKRNNRWV